MFAYHVGRLIPMDPLHPVITSSWHINPTISYDSVMTRLRRSARGATLLSLQRRASNASGLPYDRMSLRMRYGRHTLAIVWASAGTRCSGKRVLSRTRSVGASAFTQQPTGNALREWCRRPRTSFSLAHRGRPSRLRGSTDGSQSASFGSKGEDFVLARRLQ